MGRPISHPLAGVDYSISLCLCVCVLDEKVSWESLGLNFSAPMQSFLTHFPSITGLRANAATIKGPIFHTFALFYLKFRCP